MRMATRFLAIFGGLSLLAIVVVVLATQTEDGRNFIGQVQTSVAPEQPVVITPQPTGTPNAAATSTQMAQVAGEYYESHDRMIQAQIAVTQAWIEVTKAGNRRNDAKAEAEIAVSTMVAAQATATQASEVKAAAVAYANAAYATATQAFGEGLSQDAAAYGRKVVSDQSVMIDVLNAPTRYSSVFDLWSDGHLVSRETLDVNVPNSNLKEGIFIVEGVTEFELADVPYVSLKFCGMTFEMVFVEIDGVYSAQALVREGERINETHFRDRLKREMNVLQVIRVAESNISSDVLDLETQLPEGAVERVRTFFVLEIDPTHNYCEDTGEMVDRNGYTDPEIGRVNTVYLTERILLKNNIPVIYYR